MEQRNINEFFTSKEQSKCLKKWNVHDDSLLVFEYIVDKSNEFKEQNSNQQVKLALFDLDETLITTKGAHVFSKHSDDWQFLNSSVVPNLKRLASLNYKIIILTNQNRLARSFEAETSRANRLKGRTKLKPTQIDDFRLKVAKIAGAIGLNLWVLAAVKKDFYRKPKPGMFTYAVEAIVQNKPPPAGLNAQLEALQSYSAGSIVDMAHSFYVGDAAGRTNKAAGRKDHSSCDYLLARNCGLLFSTPEAFSYIMQQSQPDQDGIFNQSKLATLPAEIASTTWSFPFDPTAEQQTNVFSASDLATGQACVILVGAPGSGKSTLAHDLVARVLPNAAVVSLSSDGDTGSCAAACRRLLELGKTVLVDCPNPDAVSRRQFTAVAKTLLIPTICLWLDRTIQFCGHNLIFKHLLCEFARSYAPTDSMGTRSASQGALPFHLPTPVDYVNSIDSLYMWFHRYQPPTTSEGFQRVIKVPFVPLWLSMANRELGEKFKLLWNLYLM